MMTSTKATTFDRGHAEFRRPIEIAATTMSPAFRVALLSHETVAERTMTFRFVRPVEWRYHAGQFLRLTLLNPLETDSEGNARSFSISSAPCENVIAITTRLRDSAFMRVLQQVPLGAEVKIEGPFGDLQLHHVARPAVLLAGGIGITPFRSILVETTARGFLPYPVVLFHANRRPEDAAFAYEFRALRRTDPNFVYVPTMTAMAGSIQKWDGERGHIDWPMLRRHLDRMVDPIFYVAGPQAMVQALRAMLVAEDVGDDDIRTEEFPGY